MIVSKSLQFTDEELELLSGGLHMHRCFLETNSLSTAEEYEKMRKPVKALTVEQMRLIVRLQDLKTKIDDRRFEFSEK